MKRFFLILLVVLVVVFFALAYFAFEWSGVHAALAWIVVYTLMSSCCVAAIFMILKLLMSAFSPELRADLWSRGMHVFRACLMLFAYLFVLIPLIFGALLYGLHEWWPAKLSRYELTNGEKTVIFQSMSHLASQDFYDRVREDIRARGEEGYVLFYEGVRSGTPENQEAFTKALGFELDLSFYENLADLTGLVFQGDVDFSGLAREDINVDLSVDDIMSIFHDRDYTFASPRIADEFSEMFDQIESTIGRLTPRQRRSAQYAYQAFFTLMFHMTNSGDLSLPTEELPIFHVILDDRNAHIARAVHESEHDKIYLLYGALHYGGIVEELKRLDTTWGLIDSQGMPVLR